MTSRYCCDQRCMQGRDCPATKPQFLIPLEEDASTELTFRESLLVWLTFIAGFLVLAGLGVSAWRVFA